ncbi:DUF2461 domain-containing protein [Blastopirellula sp. JC732]|uniref:DUF2461 domain-containing protein n=1 Tax=Blastopirellula sediminis TaxID=2894196 RepID=A0A9X1MHJ4_9BACT|nr:DUF2461 domain-containing protein [Blastopirellula sediminis]MCC9608138.1 DUF2461 domain-containing protein [Blastopirellula sediminis]MCC9627069.1 DUF2461 domain-containing protein [Blastopirellula sediminis]
MKQLDHFAGFPKQTVTFLRNLRANNSKAWFDEHRGDYDQYYVTPAKAFVEAVGKKLARLSKALVAQPRINGSIYRINRDIRFSKDKTPYKDHLDCLFWEEDKKSSPSALFFRVSPDGVLIGAGAYACPDLLKKLRPAITHEIFGKELAGIAKKLRKGGLEIHGKHYKRFPSDFPTDGPAAEFLLHNSIYVVKEEPVALAQSTDLVDRCVAQWKIMLPLHAWLINHG